MVSLPLGGVVSIFGQPVVGFDVAMAAVKGRAARTTGANYTLFGVIQPAGDKAQAIAASGVKTDGQMILQTKKVLKAVDVTQTGGPASDQAYIRYQGDVWRVFKVQGWYDKNTGISRYILARTLTETVPAYVPP